MKKILALFAALCLLFSCTSAMAITVADGTALDFGDLSIALESGMYYESDAKVVNQVFLTVYPYAASGDTATNMNVMWAGSNFEVTTDLVRSNGSVMEQTMREGLEAAGVTVHSFKMDDPYEGTLAGQPCIFLDMITSVTYGSMDLDIVQRQFYFGGKGYVFTISVNDTQARETVTRLLESMLIWK